MPAKGQNKNVMCFIDAIYIYLRARGDGAMGRGRPEKHAPKPAVLKRPKINAWDDMNSNSLQLDGAGVRWHLDC